MKQPTKKIKGNLVMGRAVNILAPLIILIVVLLVLEFIARTTGISKYILPPPSQIFSSTAAAFPEIADHFLFTLKIILLGFGISVPLGIVIAALLSQSRALTAALSPVILCLIITPMITLIPILMLWLGTDPNLRLLVIILQATPIIAFNTLNGFKNVDQEKLELGKSVGATKMQTFSKITFMNAMPQVFTGVKLGVIFSTIAAISADFVAGTIGMGNRIMHYTKFNNTDITYGCILLVAVIGIVLYYIVEAVEHRVVVWKK